MRIATELPRQPFRQSDAARAGVSSRTLYRLRDAGMIEQIAHGLAQRVDSPVADLDLVEAVRPRTELTICLSSAPVHHGLTDALPARTDIAIPVARPRPLQPRRSAGTFLTPTRSPWVAQRSQLTARARVSARISQRGPSSTHSGCAALKGMRSPPRPSEPGYASVARIRPPCLRWRTSYRAHAVSSSEHWSIWRERSSDYLHGAAASCQRARTRNN
jgi:hypothetical protein